MNMVRLLILKPNMPGDIAHRLGNEPDYGDMITDDVERYGASVVSTARVHRSAFL
jgi:hypothetical protein